MKILYPDENGKIKVTGTDLEKHAVFTGDSLIICDHSPQDADEQKDKKEEE